MRTRIIFGVVPVREVPDDVPSTAQEIKMSVRAIIDHSRPRAATHGFGTTSRKARTLPYPATHRFSLLKRPQDVADESVA
jgi:hypothetical protein